MKTIRTDLFFSTVRGLLVLFSLYALALPGSVVIAQDEQPDEPVYVVQSGDLLWDIALRFGVSLEQISLANGITNPSQLNIGDRLVIPGLEGIGGELTTREIMFGENLTGLSRAFQVERGLLARLNRVTSPTQFTTGASLVLPVQEGINIGYKRWLVAPGETILELAVRSGSHAWYLSAENRLDGTWAPMPGDILLTAAADGTGPVGLPDQVAGVDINPVPAQGKASVIRVHAEAGLSLQGEFMGHVIRFFEQSPGEYVAMQGVQALAEPGRYPFTLKLDLVQGSFEYSQPVSVWSVDYPYDRPLTVDPATVDPAITRPEDAQWTALAQPVSNEKQWVGEFSFPSPLSKEYCLETGECFSSRYGNRRSYNGGPYNAFHTGLDIVGSVGTEIFAPAAGEVVFAGPLTVRGNATMIDHGWGVYTAYMHQSEIMVQVGDRVSPGQLIGLIGATGRVEGPHLHWEVWVNGVQVDPLDWLSNQYP